MKSLILNLIPWIIIAGSALGVILIILRKVPVLLKLPEKPEADQISPSIFERIKIGWQKFRHSSLQPALTSWLEKTLRKFRLMILKIDRIFVGQIEKAREQSQTMKARSRAWVEQHRLKKIEKIQVLEKLDQAQVIESIEKAKKEKEEEERKEKEIGEKELVKMIAKDPRDISAYRKLGFLYLKQGNKEDAKNCFREVLKIEPGDFEVISKIKELE